jgi:hypothetical protein
MTVAASNRTILRCKPGATPLYTRGPAAVLRTHGGIMFPYQPDISYSQQVNYNNYDLVHTNYSVNAYANTPSPSIQLTASFASVTEEEGLYTLGVLHFLRSVTKMWSGLDNDDGSVPMAGTPPPVLSFSSFGTQLFERVPVVITNFSTTFDSGVDLKYVKGQQIPVMQTIALDLMVQQSPDRQKMVFNTRSFVNGNSYTDGFV